MRWADVTFSQEFIGRIQACDSDAVARLFELCGPLLEKSIKHQLPLQLRPRLDAEDVVQQAFLSFCTYLPRGAYRFKDTLSLCRMLRTIARNKLRKEIRKHQAAKRDVRGELVDPTTLEEDRGTLQPADPHRGPADIALAHDQLLKATAGMSEQDQAIALLWLRGCAEWELAIFADKSVRTIQRLIAKVKRLLES